MTKTSSSNDMEQLDQYSFDHVLSNPWLESSVYSNHDHISEQQFDHHGFDHILSPWLESFDDHQYSYNGMEQQQLDHSFVHPWLENFEFLHHNQSQPSLQEVSTVNPQDHNTSNQKSTENWQNQPIQRRLEKQLQHCKNKSKSKRRRTNIWYWPESSKSKANSQLMKSAQALSKKEGKMMGIKNAMECIQEFEKEVKELSTIYTNLLKKELHGTMDVGSSQEDDEKSYASYIQQYHSRIGSLMKHHFNIYL